MKANADLQFESFKVDRDRELYVDGYIDAYRESFPGVALPSAVRIGLAASVEDMEQRDPSRVAITAICADEPVGFVVVTMGTFYVVPMARIEALYIATQHRRKGFARALLDRAAAWARFNGSRFVRLDVTASNQAALALYESQGYAVTRFQMDAVVA